ncbi:galactose mutarotase-like domain-containing protein [Mycotypha africana]|uniref:galactose mutarotase-like domain-containing protein n=1 Tax=Mycotypha africana TaxID=64632 RepID=UPI0023002C84|nr:galactose mutarotase-like domain-containing protein [Mycotypha africana]KAI8971789.1 galactose mutarotase-like domain-containing protein [Mycotypha africana]
MTSGCNARNANWPATSHLIRTRAIAAAYVKDPSNTYLLNQAVVALNYWLDNDFTESDCIDSGGVAGYHCPCGTPGLWNKNWFAQAIAVPTYAGDTCLLLKDKLTSEQKAICATMQSRAFQAIPTGLRPVKVITGANLLDMASVGITLGLFESNKTTVQRALEFFYGGVKVNSVVAADGIQADGSFMQHAGLLYNGNYGKDYISDLLAVFLITKGTPLEPDTVAQEAFETLIDGTEWMIVADTRLKTLLWQYSTIGRMISFKYSDGQASGGVDIDVDAIAKSTEDWDSELNFEAIVDRLDALPTEDANQGNLIGTRYFYNADYMIHRAPNYVTTLKMYSSRTINSECLNAQNPFGFHLSDGAIFNYLTGDEYVDTFAAWNWDLVPGITVDYGGTALTCSSVKKKGRKAFVGGATDGNTGIAVMDYLNPTNSNLAFKKTFFFFPSGYAVQLGPITSKNTSAPLITVLDQKRRNGDIYVSGKLRNTDTTYTVTGGTNSIWHDNIGYYFPTSEVLYVDSKPRKFDWSSIGISTGTSDAQLFTSYIKHSKTSSTGLLTQYIVQPNITANKFNDFVGSGTIPIALDFKASSPQVNAAYSAADKSIAVAFWTAGTYVAPWNSVSFTTDNPCILLFRETSTNTYRLTIADPSQSLSSIKLSITIAGATRTTTATLPTGNKAGRYTVKSMSF